MANQSHLDNLAQGGQAWNSWRKAHPSIRPNLSEANLRGADLAGADFRRADLTGTNLSEADLSNADLTRANLTRANLSTANLSKANLLRANLFEADLYRANLYKADLPDAILQSAVFYRANLSGDNLSRADLSEADLSNADLTRANLSDSNLMAAKLSSSDFSKANLRNSFLPEANLSAANLSEAILSAADLSRVNFETANLSDANLSGADLTHSLLVKTNLTGTTLTGCSIYGISAWSLKLEGAKQQNLNVSDHGEPAIMVDNLEVGQFIYLLLNNERIRQVIDTITSKVVLILGRFTPERKAVLEAIRDALRKHDLLPVLFDFHKPTSRDLTETISTLAHMARFIIADITDAKSIPQELQAIVPNLPSVPVQPLVLASDYEYGMFEHFKRYPWVLEVYRYDDPHEVLTSLEAKIITPAVTKAIELSK